MHSVCVADVISLSTLYAAWEKVRANDEVGGVDGVSLNAFAANLRSNLDTLANEVTYNTYRPHPLLRVEVEKKSGGTRPLSISVIRDRVLQTAVALVLTPLFETEFEDISFAYRKGRSVNQAVARIERLRNQGYQWVVDADIQTFFDQVDHKLLMRQVKQLVKDKEILRLIRQWLKSSVVDGKKRYRLTKGVPQGSPISPMLANLYLDQLDEMLLDNQYQLIRYADDFVILCKSKHQAERALQLTGEVLEKLRLCFNQRKTGITYFNRGFRFLGVEFIRSLAIRNKYSPADDMAENHIIKPDPVIQTVTPELEDKNSEPLTEMQLAFLQAGITPGQFVQKTASLAALPSESSEPEALEPPELDETHTSSYDPRLNPHVGYLHPLRQGHPALASDVMEEFRASIVDSVVFNIALNNKLTPDDFTLPEHGGEACLLSKDARKFFISQLEIKLNSRLRHPVSGLQLDYRRCIEHQINHLVAVIRETTPDYQPMIIR